VKVAYFSPFPPKKTGIATYSHHLVAALAAQVDVHLFDSGPAYSPAPDLPIVDFTARPETLAGLDRFDICLYHLGNNPWFHLEIYKLSLREPGVVVLHDTVLYFLIAGLGLGGLAKEMGINYGLDGLQQVPGILNDSPNRDPLRYRFPERYPLLARTLAGAKAIIVHSQTARECLRRAGRETDVHVVQLLSYPRDASGFTSSELAQLRSRYGLRTDEIVVGAFGFIDRTKHIPAVLAALKRLRGRISFRLLIVGEGEDIEGALDATGLAERVIRPGFVSDSDFKRLLELSDIVVNLRYPSMGETSATVIQAMSAGKPCIVTDHAWLAELPDTCVRKVGYGEHEVVELEQALLNLAEDPAARRELGGRAREYVAVNNAPAHVADGYVSVLQTVVNKGLGSDVMLERNGGDWLEAYLRERLRQALSRRSPPVTLIGKRSSP